MWIQLASESELHTDLKFDIDELPVSIGRSVTADVTIADELLSRIHCELLWRGGEFVVRDLESTNGTIVNAQVVMESVLVSRDILTLGDARYEVVLGAESATENCAEQGTVPDGDLYPKP